MRVVSAHYTVPIVLTVQKLEHTNEQKRKKSKLTHNFLIETFRVKQNTIKMTKIVVGEGHYVQEKYGHLFP